MTDLHNARIAAHRMNLMRYRRILSTSLTDTERTFVEQRIDEERRQLEQLELSSTSTDLRQDLANSA